MRFEGYSDAGLLAGTALDYAPECIVVSPGTTVRFEGPFSDLNLVGGRLPIPDTESPFDPATTSETMKDFALITPGTFPYFGRPQGTPPAFPPWDYFLPWGAVIVENAR